MIDRREIDLAPRSVRTPALWMIGASLAFTGMAACIKLAADHGVPIGQITFYRGLISLVLICGYLRWLRLPLATQHWRAHLQRGVAGFAGMVAYIAAISLLPLATAVTLNYTSPLLLGFLLLVIHRERPHPLIVAAMLSGLCGVVMLLRPTYDASQGLGALVALASAVLAAVSALNIRALGRLDEHPVRSVLYFSLFLTVGSVPLLLLSDPYSLDPDGVMYLCAVGALATFGQIMLTVAYQRGHTLLVSLLGYSQVVFTSLLAVVIWDDQPPLMSWMGMALIVLSGAAATIFVRPAAAPAETRG